MDILVVGIMGVGIVLCCFMCMQMSLNNTFTKEIIKLRRKLRGIND